MSDGRRQLFHDDPERRRRRLLRQLAAAGALVLVALLTEITPAPQPVTVSAAVFAIAALAVATRTVLELGRADRRRIQQAETTIDLTDSALIVVDDRARITLANPAACDIFGRAETELLGHEIQAFFSAESREASRAAFVALMGGRIAPGEHRSRRVVVRPDGEERTLECHAALRHGSDGGVCGLLVSAGDVTEREARERARRRERADVEQLQILLREVARSDDARPAVVERVQALTEASLVGLAEPDGEGRWEYTAATDSRLVGQTLSKDAPSGTLLVSRTGKSCFVSDVDDSAWVSRALVDRFNVRTLLFQPVLDGDAVIGVLSVAWSQHAERLDERREQLVGLAADEATIALARRNLMEDLRSAAMRDPLTGLLNRRAFDERLTGAIATALPGDDALTVVLLDLNRFKAVNDTAGHQAGDKLLVDCARSWAHATRGRDGLARLGGDEFGLILTGCDAAQAEVIVERLRAATPHGAGAAIGVATFDGDSPAELLRRADDALYDDKAAARGLHA